MNQQAFEKISIKKAQDRTDRLLRVGKAKGFSAMEVGLSVHLGFDIAARQQALESLEHNQTESLHIRAFLNKREVNATTSDLSDSALDRLIDKLSTLAKYTEKDPHSGLPNIDDLAFHSPDLELHQSWKISPEEAIEKSLIAEAVVCEKFPHLYSDRITFSTHEGFRWLANSENLKAFYPYSSHNFSASFIAKKRGEMQTDYDYTASRMPNALRPFDQVALRAAKRTEERLGARKIKTASLPVIFESRVATTLWRHFLSAISGTSLYRGTSFLQDKLGKKLFPNFVNLSQEPHLIGGLHSAPFDKEGVYTRKINYVESGYLRNYLLNSYSARRLGLKTTGNSGGIYNLIVSAQDLNLKQLCHQMGKGLLVTELLGQGVNIVTGDYSRGAFGYWVENGEVQYPVQEITIAGSLLEMFEKMVAIGNDRQPEFNIQTGSLWIDRMAVAGQ